MRRIRAIVMALAIVGAVALCAAGRARPALSDNLTQVTVEITADGIPAGSSWSFELGGVTSSGPSKVVVNVGDAIAPVFQDIVQDGQSADVRYVLAAVEPLLPVKIDAPTTVTAHYRTEYRLTVSTSGLGVSSTAVRNGAVTLGKATDAAPLQLWLSPGTPLALAVDDPVAVGNDWAFLQGLTPSVSTLTGPVAITAGYASMLHVIDGELAAGGILGPNAKGIADELKQAWIDGPAVPDVGQPSRNGGVPGSFLTHVVIRASQLAGTTVRRLALDAASVYREQICLHRAAPLRHALQYAWYSGIVFVFGGRPRPDC